MTMSDEVQRIADTARSARRLRLQHLAEIVHEEIYGMPCVQGTMETCLWAASEAMDRLEAEEAAARIGGSTLADVGDGGLADAEEVGDVPE